MNYQPLEGVYVFAFQAHKQMQQLQINLGQELH